MGFYDGMAPGVADASSYQVARDTETPVVLVVNGRGASLSLAAVIRGIAEFLPCANVRGVVLNKTSAAACAYAAPAIEKHTGVAVLGNIPADEAFSLESRHLGLVTADEVEQLSARIDKMAELVEKSVDVDRLLEIAATAPDICEEPYRLEPIAGARPIVAVARDEAFSFYYEENLRALEDLGCELAFFSPLCDSELPRGQAPSIWGGGYPSSMCGSSPRTRRCARRCGVRWNPACRRLPNAVGFCTCSAKSPIARGGAGLLWAPLWAQARTGKAVTFRVRGAHFPTRRALRAARHTHPRARVPLLAVHLPGRRLFGRKAPARQRLAVHDDYPVPGCGLPACVLSCEPRRCARSRLPQRRSQRGDGMAEATETALACIREEVERAFSSAPGAVLEAALSRIAPADECARAAAYAAWDSIAHPFWGDWAILKMPSRVSPQLRERRGGRVSPCARSILLRQRVVAEGVSQKRTRRDASRRAQHVRGATSACRMAAFAGAEVVPVDVGMARGIKTRAWYARTCGRGEGTSRTAPLCLAMGLCARSRSESPSRAGLLAPACAFAAGEMGIGNTTTSAAVAAVLIRADARASSRGAGLSDASLARKRDVVERAIDANSPDPADPIDVLSKVGGFDIAAMCGFYLGPRPRRRRRSSTGHILHGGPVRGAPCQRLGLPRGHPRIERTRKPGAPSRARHKGTPRRRHARARARAPWRICPFWIRRCACTGMGRRSRRLAWLLTSISRLGNDGDARHRRRRGGKAPTPSPCASGDGPRVPGNDGALREEGARRIARHRALREGKGFPPSSARVTWAPQCPGFRAAARFFWRTWAIWSRTELFAEGGLSPRDPDAAAREVLGDIERLAQAAAYTVVVSVDVFADGMRYDEGTGHGVARSRA